MTIICFINYCQVGDTLNLIFVQYYFDTTISVYAIPLKMRKMSLPIIKVDEQYRIQLDDYKINYLNYHTNCNCM